MIVGEALICSHSLRLTLSANFPTSLVSYAHELTETERALGDCTWRSMRLDAATHEPDQLLPLALSERQSLHRAELIRHAHRLFAEEEGPEVIAWRSGERLSVSRPRFDQEGEALKQRLVALCELDLQRAKATTTRLYSAHPHSIYLDGRLSAVAQFNEETAEFESALTEETLKRVSGRQLSSVVLSFSALHGEVWWRLGLRPVHQVRPEERSHLTM